MCMCLLTVHTNLFRLRSVLLSFIHIMSTSNWVSHTPDTKISQDHRTENDTFYNPLDEIPPSPLNAYEKFFLPASADSNQFAVAARASTSIGTSTRSLRRNISLTSESIRTDDFASAIEELSAAEDDSDCDTDIDADQLSIERALYSDILGLSSPILEDEEHPSIPSKIDEMASKNKQRKKNKNKTTVTSTTTSSSDTPAKMTTPTPTTMEKPSESEAPHFHVVDHVYEGAKTAWATTKGFILFSPFMGIAEEVTAKVLSISTGVESLEVADKNIKPHLSGIDCDLLDPAIAKLLGLVEAVVGKGDEILKGLVGFVHKPKMPVIEEGEEEELEEVVAPETSTPVAAEA